MIATYTYVVYVYIRGWSDKVNAIGRVEKRVCVYLTASNGDCCFRKADKDVKKIPCRDCRQRIVLIEATKLIFISPGRLRICPGR